MNSEVACAGSSYVVYNGKCYPACTPTDSNMLPCICLDAAFGYFYCPDNTACQPLYPGNPCQPPRKGFLTMCNGIPSRCLICQDRYCISCQDGYYLNNGQCKLCSLNSQHSCYCEGSVAGACYTCSSEKPSKCSTCYNQHYMEFGICFKCPGRSIEYKCVCGSNEAAYTLNCRECADQYTVACSSCFDGYYLTPDGRCASCGEKNQRTGCYCAFSPANNCNLCLEDGSSRCKNCYAGYYLDSNRCLPCAAGCEECESATVCSSCKFNHYFSFENGLQLCRYCEPNMEVDSQASGCVCRPGYTRVGKCESIYAVCLFTTLQVLLVLFLCLAWFMWRRYQQNASEQAVQ